MEYRIITPVSEEPVSLAEAKTHLRLTSSTFAEDIESNISIAPGLHNAAENYGLEGEAVDVLDYLSVVSLTAGNCGVGGSVAAKIQESDDTLVWEDYPNGEFVQITEENDNTVFELNYSGGKQYIRVVATIEGAACSFGADVLLKSGDDVEDDLILLWIRTARSFCENRVRRALATQTIELYMENFPSESFFELPRPPLRSITSIKYKDYEGTETTLIEDTDFHVDTERNIGRVVLSYGGSWPSFTPHPVNPIKVRYVAGYDDDNPIPDEIKSVILLLVGHYYEHREAVNVGAINMSQKLLLGVDNLLSLHKAGWF